MKRDLVRIGFAALTCAMLLLPASLRAATIYVDNNDATCHGVSPCFSTIQAAVDAAEAGDTVSIAPSVYFEQVVIAEKNNSDAVTDADRIVITGYDAILSGTGGNCNNGSALRLRGSKFITVRGLTFTGSAGAAIDLAGGSNRNSAVHIERNRIFGNGTGGCNGGIVIGAANAATLIVNNLIYANSRNGIEIASGAGPHYIIGNTIDGNHWNGVNAADRGSVLLVNNIITHNGAGNGLIGGRSGIRRSGRARLKDIHMLNNLICGNRTGEITGRFSADGQSGNLTPTGGEGTGFAASPGCEDNVFNGLDFNLGPHSPAIDAGVDPRTLGLNSRFNTIVEFDFFDDGFRRPQDIVGSGGVFDIGAIEAIDPRPKARNANTATVENTPVQVSLHGSAGDPAKLSVNILSAPNHGSLSAVDQFICAIADDFDRRFAFDICVWTTTYTPHASFIGTDSFTFTTSDSGLESPPGTVTITVAEPQS